MSIQFGILTNLFNACQEKLSSEVQFPHNNVIEALASGVIRFISFNSFFLWEFYVYRLITLVNPINF